MKISACLIVKNEAANLEKCLQSIYQSVDEIIVVDTGSKDATVSIAKQYGAKVFTFTWENDFSAAKNFALTKAKGNWIVFLDGDEYFSAETAQRLRQVILKYYAQCDAFTVCRINIDADQENKVLGYFYPIRIFRATPLIRYVGKIHETIVRLDGKSLRVLKIPSSELELMHTGYSSSIVEAKCRRNLPIVLKGLEVNPNDVSLLSYLVDCYFNLKDYALTVQYTRKLFSYDTSNLEYCSRIYRRFIKALQCVGSSATEMEEVILSAIQRFPAMPDFYCEYALFLMETGRYEAALSYLGKADQLDDDYKEEEPSFYCYLRKPKENLQAMLYAEKNDFVQALTWYCRILKEDKYNENALKHVILILKHEDPVQLIAFFNEIYAKDDRKDLDFLIGNLKRYNKSKTLAYYLHISQNSQKDSFEKALAFCCVGKYDAAVVVLHPLIAGAEKLSSEKRMEIYHLFAVCLMVNKQAPTKEYIAHLPPDLQHVVQRFFSQEEKLQPGDRNAYFALVEEICSVQENMLAPYISCASDFSTEALLELTQVFIQLNLFQVATEIAELALERSDHCRFKAIEKAAYGAYRNQDYKKARKYYEQIVPNRVEDVAANQYYEWTCEYLETKGKIDKN